MFFYLSQYFGLVYGTMCWQGDQGYNACAVTPHAAQMSSIIQRLRLQLQNLAMLLLPLAAVMVTYLPAYTGCPSGADPVCAVCVSLLTHIVAYSCTSVDDAYNYARVLG